jgi:hypothetical protein
MPSTLRTVRREIIERHVEAENERDVEAALATFTHPRYEIVPTGAVFDGEEEVRAFLLANWDSLPQDLHWEALGLYDAEHGVMVETRSVGTTDDGRPIDYVTVNLFGFDGEALVLERCWFDRATVATMYPPSDGST